jgi:hypothetical protein
METFLEYVDRTKVTQVKCCMPDFVSAVTNVRIPLHRLISCLRTLQVPADCNAMCNMKKLQKFRKNPLPLDSSWKWPDVHAGVAFYKDYFLFTVEPGTHFLSFPLCTSAYRTPCHM